MVSVHLSACLSRYNSGGAALTQSGRRQPGCSQWRSQECELGASPPLPPPSPLPLPLLTGARGYKPWNFFEIEGARR